MSDLPFHHSLLQSSIKELLSLKDNSFDSIILLPPILTRSIWKIPIFLTSCQKKEKINICANQLTTGYIKLTLTHISAMFTKISFSFIFLVCSV